MLQKKKIQIRITFNFHFMATTETESIKIYGGETEIIFYPNSHRYKVG